MLLKQLSTQKQEMIIMRKIDKSKLYAGMTLEERARLAFKFTVLNDSDGLNNILATIPKKTYLMNDPAFFMRSTGLYQAGLLWGFSYQKEQGLNSSHLGILALIDENTNDPELKQLRIKAGIKYQHSCDRLEILFNLLDELDESHGLDTELVYAIAEVRCIAVGNTILAIEGATLRTLPVNDNPDAKNKNQACRDYYKMTKALLLIELNKYQRMLGNKTDINLEEENKRLKEKLKKLETEG